MYSNILVCVVWNTCFCVCKYENILKNECLNINDSFFKGFIFVHIEKYVSVYFRSKQTQKFF